MGATPLPRSPTGIVDGSADSAPWARTSDPPARATFSRAISDATVARVGPGTSGEVCRSAARGGTPFCECRSASPSNDRGRGVSSCDPASSGLTSRLCTSRGRVAAPSWAVSPVRPGKAARPADGSGVPATSRPRGSAPFLALAACSAASGSARSTCGCDPASSGLTSWIRGFRDRAGDSALLRTGSPVRSTAASVRRADGSRASALSRPTGAAAVSVSAARPRPSACGRVAGRTLVADTPPSVRTARSSVRMAAARSGGRPPSVTVSARGPVVSPPARRPGSAAPGCCRVTRGSPSGRTSAPLLAGASAAGAVPSPAATSRSAAAAPSRSRDLLPGAGPSGAPSNPWGVRGALPGRSRLVAPCRATTEPVGARGPSSDRTSPPAPVRCTPVPAEDGSAPLAKGSGPAFKAATSPAGG